MQDNAVYEVSIFFYAVAFGHDLGLLVHFLRARSVNAGLVSAEEDEVFLRLKGLVAQQFSVCLESDII